MAPIPLRRFNQNNQNNNTYTTYKKERNYNNNFEYDFDNNEKFKKIGKCSDSDSSNYVGFKSPATVATNRIWTLPAIDGNTGQALITNGSGTLSWGESGATVENDTTTNSTMYPTFSTATSGGVTSLKVSSTKMTFNPSTGLLTVTSLTESSSAALKENINPITNALDYIMQLTGVTYDRRDGSKKNEAGLIAEDVDKVLPNLVTYDEKGAPSGINYTKFTAYLIESIKTLKEEIDRLKGSK
jgi:hypothetical protein